ncbi:MAG: hypothetical protein IKZ60_05225 [Bacteroidales bacterium]|nr:hypothetical protein [Bacteroidales bacterium]
MIATISADIVRSTSLKTRDLMALRDKLRGLLDQFEEEYPAFWARIVRGDSVECVVPEYRLALRIAILIKLFVKVQAACLDCHELLLRHGIRFSIGIGSLDYADKKDDIINGEAIYISGRNLDEISRKSSIFTVLEMAAAPRAVNDMMDSYVALLGNLVDSYSAKQAEVVFYKLRGYKETEISERLGIYQSSVNMRSSQAQWGLLRTAIRDFEEMDYECLCG